MQLQSRLKRIFAACIGPVSHTTYLHHWNTLVHFGVTVLNKPVDLPVETNFVCLFIAHLQSLGLKYSTIRNYTSAIAFVHRISGHADPTADQRVSKVLQGVCNLETKASKSLLPITKPILHSLVDAIPFCSAVVYNRTMFKAIFLVCFYACLWVGEIVVTPNANHTLSLEQLTRTSQGYSIKFNSYKHSNSASELPSFNLSPTNTQYCPVSSLDKYLAQRGTKKGPIFLNESGLPVDRQQLVQFLKACMSMCGLPTEKFNSHSFRIGRATQLSLEQVPDDKIKKIGRWKSNAYLQYIRHQHLILPSWVFRSRGPGPIFLAVGIQQSLLGQDCLWRSLRDHQAIMMDHELVTIKIIGLLPASALAVLGTTAAMVR